MRYRLLLVGLLVLGATPLPASARPNDTADDARARTLVRQVVEAVGGQQRLRQLHDVQFTYTYRLPDGKEDVSIERYVFDGELSWARYTKREAVVLPQLKGEMIQAFDGKSSWMTVAGRPVTDPKLLKMADFLRKTNYYWLTMMFKLLDPGVHHRYQGEVTVDGKRFHLVRIGFSEGVGDVQDTYVLYINPKTKLVDQFLFTVLDFGIEDPNLMRVRYETIEGLKLPTYREYARATWDGRVLKPKWTKEISTGFSFGKNPARSLFSPAKR
jgi:hypothetical protein